MIRNDEELVVQRELLATVERIVESWKSKLLPHNPGNFALYAEGAIEQADLLRAEIDEYLARRKSMPSDVNPSSAVSRQQPTNVG